jgi:hypothetical protein
VLACIVQHVHEHPPDDAEEKEAPIVGQKDLAELQKTIESLSNKIDELKAKNI